MAFLNATDYDVQIRSEINKIIDPSTEQTKLKRAEDMAIDQIKNYLAGRYNLDLIFVDAPAEGVTDQRDNFIVMITIDITLYHLWCKEGGNNIPQTRIDRYADALDWLKAVQKGAATNLPLITNDEGEIVGDLRIWSAHAFEDNRY
ncbi:MAG: DUF1320 family protein [Bacteroidetes bacterium]|nr:DUF1320 family protein [Bacteroidota bacterium]